LLKKLTSAKARYVVSKFDTRRIIVEALPEKTRKNVSHFCILTAPKNGWTENES
jgi:hypothetical protein